MILFSLLFLKISFLYFLIIFLLSSEMNIRSSVLISIFKFSSSLTDIGVGTCVCFTQLLCLELERKFEFHSSVSVAWISLSDTWVYVVYEYLGSYTYYNQYVSTEGYISTGAYMRTDLGPVVKNVAVDAYVISYK